MANPKRPAVQPQSPARPQNIGLGSKQYRPNPVKATTKASGGNRLPLSPRIAKVSLHQETPDGIVAKVTTIKQGPKPKPATNSYRRPRPR